VPDVGAYFKWGAYGIAALLVALAGWQVASWRAGSLEAERLRVEAVALKEAAAAEKAQGTATDTARVNESADISQTETELRAQIATLQAKARTKVQAQDCALDAETIGDLNKASGYE